MAKPNLEQVCGGIRCGDWRSLRPKICRRICASVVLATLRPQWYV